MSKRKKLPPHSKTKFGHKIISNGGGCWRYEDTGTPTKDDNRSKRPCPKCGKYQTKLGHDPCIKNLPGTAYACCGHGTEEGYVCFLNGVTIRGKFDGTKQVYLARDYANTGNRRDHAILELVKAELALRCGERVAELIETTKKT